MALSRLGAVRTGAELPAGRFSIAVAVACAAAAATAGACYYYYHYHNSGQDSSSRDRGHAAGGRNRNPRPGTGSSGSASGKRTASGHSINTANFEKLKKSVNEIKDEPQETKEKLATEINEAANKLYIASKYEDAAAYYSLAIEVCPSILTAWTNRAACNICCRNFDKVIFDCSHVIENDCSNQKAYFRRSQAYYRLGKYRESLNDMSTLNVLQGFKNESSVVEAEKLLNLIATAELKTCGIVPRPRLPSGTICATFLASFPELQLEGLKREDFQVGTPEAHFFTAVDFCTAGNYDEAMIEIKRCVATVSPASPVFKEALGLHISFCMLCGMLDEAEAFLRNLWALDPSKITTIIQRSSVCIERGETDEAISILDPALQQQPNDPYLNYHRGQVAFLRNNFIQASTFFQKAYEAKPEFIYAAIQYAVNTYKGGKEEKAVQIFEDMLKKYPENGDLHNYYGELLFDKGEHEKAQKHFERSVQLNPQSVFAYINLATLYQLNRQATEASKCYREASLADPRSDVAILQHAAYLVHNGNVKEGMDEFNRVYELAKSVNELQTYISSKERSMANHEVSQRLPAELIQSCILGEAL